MSSTWTLFNGAPERLPESFSGSHARAGRARATIYHRLSNSSPSPPSTFSSCLRATSDVGGYILLLRRQRRGPRGCAPQLMAEAGKKITALCSTLLFLPHPSLLVIRKQVAGGGPRAKREGVLIHREASGEMEPRRTRDSGRPIGDSQTEKLP